MLIEANNISKKFGQKELFSNLSLEVGQNDSIIITGKSGSGKSTLLNILSLIEEVDSGELLWRDDKITKLDSSKVNRIIRNEIGYLFQNYALLDNKTVYENVEIGIKYRKLERTETKKDIILEAINRVGLEGLEDRKVYSLSGGEQQRVALSRIIVKPCSIIFADEPTGNLDSVNAKKIMDILFELHKDGKALVVVSHDNNISERFNKQIAL